MDRRRFLLTSLAGILVERVGAEAEQAGKIHQIGYLAVRSASDSFPFRDALRHGLSELGWVERRNIVIEYRFAEGRYDRMQNLATELVLLKVDVIVAEGTAAAAAAKSATRTIPIVATSVSDPVGIGLIASLARPSGNVTGLSYSVGNETVIKTLELLREIVPNVRRVAILSNPAHPTQPGTIQNLNVAARSLGLQLQLLEARGPNDFDGAFAAMAKEGAEAVLVVADAMFGFHRTRLAELAAKSRLPAAYGVREHVEAGGLLFYGPSVSDLFRRAATYVDKILKGAKPADLPFEQPTKFELVINLKTAKALGLTIPRSLLLRADHVIE